MYILLTITVQKIKSKTQIPKMLILQFKFILYDYFDSCLIVITPITQNSKITGFVNWRKR